MLARSVDQAREWSVCVAVEVLPGGCLWDMSVPHCRLAVGGGRLSRAALRVLLSMEVTGTWLRSAVSALTAKMRKLLRVDVCLTS